MKIQTLELLISISKAKLHEIPEHEEIDGLESDAVTNFKNLSDAITDAEDTLKRMKNNESVKKLFNGVKF